MKPVKKFVSPLLLLLAFIGLVIFISTSFEMSTIAAGKVAAVSIGFGTPWYQQVLRPSGFSRELNLLTPSFLAA
jgi:hypothetical protein